MSTEYQVNFNANASSATVRPGSTTSTLSIQRVLYPHDDGIFRCVGSNGGVMDSSFAFTVRVVGMCCWTSLIEALFLGPKSVLIWGVLL